MKHRPGVAAAAAAAIQKQKFIRKSQDMVMQEVFLKKNTFQYSILLVSFLGSSF